MRSIVFFVTALLCFLCAALISCLRRRIRRSASSSSVFSFAQLCIVSAFLIAFCCSERGEQLLGLTAAVSDFVGPSRALLKTWCHHVRANNITLRAAQVFDVDARFDYSRAFVKKTNATRAAAVEAITYSNLAEVARRFLVRENTEHSFFSSKVALRRLFAAQKRIPIPRGVAFHASELLEETDARRMIHNNVRSVASTATATRSADGVVVVVGSKAEREELYRSSPLQWKANARETVCGAVFDDLLRVSNATTRLVLKPAQCVLAEGRRFFDIVHGSREQFLQSQHCDDFMSATAAALSCVSIDEAFHMHRIEPGVIIQRFFQRGLEGSSNNHKETSLFTLTSHFSTFDSSSFFSSLPLLPLIARFFSGDYSVAELKVMTFWGKAVVIHTRAIRGHHYILPASLLMHHNDDAPSSENASCAADARCSRFQDENANFLFEDGTLAKSDFSWALRHVRRCVDAAEKIARASGISALRVDFFISRSPSSSSSAICGDGLASDDDDDDNDMQLNEIEVVSGQPYREENCGSDELEKCMGDLWIGPLLLDEPTYSVTKRKSDGGSMFN